MISGIAGTSGRPNSAAIAEASASRSGRAGSVISGNPISMLKSASRLRRLGVGAGGGGGFGGLVGPGGSAGLPVVGMEGMPLGKPPPLPPPGGLGSGGKPLGAPPPGAEPPPPGKTNGIDPVGEGNGIVWPDGKVKGRVTPEGSCRFSSFWTAGRA